MARFTVCEGNPFAIYDAEKCTTYNFYTLEDRKKMMKVLEDFESDIWDLESRWETIRERMK